MPRETYTVTIFRDPRLSVREMEAFIREEINAAKGHYSPEDPRSGHKRATCKRKKQ